eukprot:COSAG01_NODE_23288_length_810_cov_22.361997_2_plen_140_part_00
MGPHAPHLPSTPAPWYADHPIGLTPLPRDGPDWNYSAKAMHAFLPKEPVINLADLSNIEDEHSKRLRSLLSVDDIVREVYAYLVSVDEWKNTFFFYTSDRELLPPPAHARAHTHRDLCRSAPLRAQSGQSRGRHTLNGA